ncbi:hypothetical protein PSTT_05837 [Puccinia striiformis]|uniref:Uncharacterized protein n=1 Tax=Puccinia striiformis TaxID=27350 RepID=A0A2S4VMC8_9BASI|nr:hypothetical protein PSTT_05837 [Puccinia striiformis]
MIEVLQLVDPNDDPDYSQNHTPDDNNGKNHPKSIIKYHFDSLAHDNSSDLATIKSISLPKDLNQFTEPPPILSDQPTDPTITGARKMPVPVKCYGLQLVSKFNASESESRKVLIWLGLWRLRGIGNDGRGTNLVLTFQSAQPPIFIPPCSLSTIC